jgi:hypothetical protein
MVKAFSSFAKRRSDLLLMIPFEKLERWNEVPV